MTSLLLRCSPDNLASCHFDKKKLFSEHHLALAYDWLVRQRHGWLPDADIWHLRFHWISEGHAILNSVNQGDYLLSPMQVVRKSSEEKVVIWNSRDALVIKMLTLVLEGLLPVHPQCEHIRGNGLACKAVSVYISTFSNRMRPLYSGPISGGTMHPSISPGFGSRSLLEFNTRCCCPCYGSFSTTA